MECSTSGLPIVQQLLELAQTHVHWVGNAIQTSYLLTSPSPPAFNLSPNQGLFQWVSSPHQMHESSGVSASVSVLPMTIQDWFPLELTGFNIQLNCVCVKFMYVLTYIHFKLCCKYCFQWNNFLMSYSLYHSSQYITYFYLFAVFTHRLLCSTFLDWASLVA